MQEYQRVPRQGARHPFYCAVREGGRGEAEVAMATHEPMSARHAGRVVVLRDRQV